VRTTARKAATTVHERLRQLLEWPALGLHCLAGRFRGTPGQPAKDGEQHGRIEVVWSKYAPAVATRPANERTAGTRPPPVEHVDLGRGQHRENHTQHESRRQSDGLASHHDEEGEDEERYGPGARLAVLAERRPSAEGDEWGECGPRSPDRGSRTRYPG
jgi:hypothetical protein